VTWLKQKTHQNLILKNYYTNCNRVNTATKLDKKSAYMTCEIKANTHWVSTGVNKYCIYFII